MKHSTPHPPLTTPSRRDILALATCALGTAAGLTPARAQSAPHTFKLGAADITVISDGSMTLPAAFAFPETDPKDAAALFGARGNPTSGIRAEVNVVVVKTPAALVVIDCGGTQDFMPTLGGFPDRLEAAGIKAADVTHVVFTHAHADHLWGVIDPLDDDTRFPTARHIMTAVERDFWLKPDTVDSMPDALKGVAIGTNRRLGLLAKRIESVRAGAEIISGMTLIDTAGHTPGHVSVRLDFGSAALLVGGDALTNSIVSFERPKWAWGPDLDRDTAVATRLKLLDQLATDRLTLLGYHMPWPGLGRVERKDGAFRFVSGG
jgi:glyoxylase-like metal-dependent hydrolase (beta-lactamase superfamily II)